MKNAPAADVNQMCDPVRRRNVYCFSDDCISGEQRCCSEYFAILHSLDLKRFCLCIGTLYLVLTINMLDVRLLAIKIFIN